MPKLRTYIDERKAVDPKFTQAAFADLVETTPATISRLCAGELPGLELAYKIDVATDRQVGLRDWFEGEPAAATAPEIPPSTSGAGEKIPA